jgi:hypothetical protein
VRDQRDPQKLGEKLLGDARAARETYRTDIPLSEVYVAHIQYLDIPDYDGSGPMANDPAKHHSKTPQTVNLQEPSDGPLGDS